MLERPWIFFLWAPQTKRWRRRSNKERVYRDVPVKFLASLKEPRSHANLTWEMFGNLQIGGAGELRVYAVSVFRFCFRVCSGKQMLRWCFTDHLPFWVVRVAMGDFPADDYIENTVRLEKSFCKYFGKSLVFRCRDVSGWEFGRFEQSGRGDRRRWTCLFTTTPWWTGWRAAAGTGEAARVRSQERGTKVNLDPCWPGRGWPEPFFFQAETRDDCQKNGAGLRLCSPR